MMALLSRSVDARGHRSKSVHEQASVLASSLAWHRAHGPAVCGRVGVGCGVAGVCADGDTKEKVHSTSDALPCGPRSRKTEGHCTHERAGLKGGSKEREK